MVTCPCDERRDLLIPLTPIKESLRRASGMYEEIVSKTTGAKSLLGLDSLARRQFSCATIRFVITHTYRHLYLSL